MNGQEAVLFPVSLSLSISPQEADAGTALTLKAVAECPEQYDLSGDPVLFLDATGHEVGRAPLAALEGDDFGAEITVTAPIELGEYGLSLTGWCGVRDSSEVTLRHRKMKSGEGEQGSIAKRWSRRTRTSCQRQDRVPRR